MAVQVPWAAMAATAAPRTGAMEGDSPSAAGITRQDSPRTPHPRATALLNVWSTIPGTTPHPIPCRRHRQPRLNRHISTHRPFSLNAVFTLDSCRLKASFTAP